VPIINLNETSIAARKQYSGQGSYSVTAGQSLKIKTAPHGEEILDVECPSGKVWEAVITVNLVERDV